MTHSFNPTALREYDIRGIVGQTLGPDDAYAIGRGFGTRVRRNGGTRVAVGYDIRLSSREFAAAVSEGLMEAGVDVIDIGTCGTEQVYFATSHLGLDGGVMVTASHNPADYNGLKLVRDKAKPISAATSPLLDCCFWRSGRPDPWERRSIFRDLFLPAYC